MTDPRPYLSRRRLLALAGVLPVAGAHASPATPLQRPAGVVDAATVLIAGPEGGGLDRWGRTIQPALGQALSPNTTLTIVNAGGLDGVTGANQFATRGEPDGRTMLLAPPEAVLAWLIGDPRAKYDLGRWTTVMAATTPAILVLRQGLGLKQKPMRIAMPDLASTALAGVLALELMGGRAEPVIGVGPDAQVTAFATGGIDAVLARGARSEEQVQSLMQAGGWPVAALGAAVPGPDGAGVSARDPAFPAVPTVGELISATSPLLESHAAIAAAARLQFTLVLPHLTPAARVAVWRQAAAEAAHTLDVQAMALAIGARTVGGSDAAVAANPIVASPAALQALRAWMADRFKFKPA